MHLVEGIKAIDGSRHRNSGKLQAVCQKFSFIRLISNNQDTWRFLRGDAVGNANFQITQLPQDICKLSRRFDSRASTELSLKKLQF